jgi:hypothetical protein
LLSSRNFHAAFSASFFEALYPRTGLFDLIAESAVTWSVGQHEASRQYVLRADRVPVFLSVILSSYTHVLGRVQYRNSTAKKHHSLDMWSTQFMCALQKTSSTSPYVSSLGYVDGVCDLPLNSWIDEFFLEIGDTKTDWRCRVDDVVKSVLLLLEYVVKGTRCDDVLHKHKSDLVFPCWMKFQDLLSFGFRSQARGGLVS